MLLVSSFLSLLPYFVASLHRKLYWIRSGHCHVALYNFDTSDMSGPRQMSLEKQRLLDAVANAQADVREAEAKLTADRSGGQHAYHYAKKKYDLILAGYALDTAYPEPFQGTREALEAEVQRLLKDMQEKRNAWRASRAREEAARTRLHEARKVLQQANEMLGRLIRREREEAEQAQMRAQAARFEETWAGRAIRGIARSADIAGAALSGDLQRWNSVLSAHANPGRFDQEGASLLGDYDEPSGTGAVNELRGQHRRPVGPPPRPSSVAQTHSARGASHSTTPGSRLQRSGTVANTGAHRPPPGRPSPHPAREHGNGRHPQQSSQPIYGFQHLAAIEAARRRHATATGTGPSLPPPRAASHSPNLLARSESSSGSEGGAQAYPAASRNGEQRHQNKHWKHKRQ